MTRIHLTGRVGIETGSPVAQRLEPGGRQARLLLAYLVLERHRAVPREELAEALWPGRPPHSWEAALRVVVSKVRSVLTDGVTPTGSLTCAFGCYQSHLSPEVTVDVEVAIAVVAAAEAALAMGHVDTAIDGASDARAIASQAFLPGEASDWAENIRGRLRGCLLASLEVISQGRARQGHAAGALEAAEQAVTIDPFRESAHRCLMAAHAEGGNRAAALKAYERCRRLLAAELGVGPSHETEDAYVDLLQSDGDQPGEPAPVRTRETAIAVPLPDALRASAPENLVGREPELLCLKNAWESASRSRRQIVVITGEAGIGKTALSAYAAQGLDGEDVSVLYGRCDKNILVPYQPFVEAIDRYVRTCPPERLRQEVGPEANDLARLVVDLPRRLPELSLPPPAEPETERHRLFGAVAAFLNAASETTPIMMILDDFQWAGNAAVVLFRYLLRALESSPVLVVVCYRDDEPDSAAPVADVMADLTRETGVHRLQLPGLDDKAVVELLTSFLANADGDLDLDLVRTLQERTAGSPLFITELLRQAVDSWPTDRATALLRIRSTLTGLPLSIQDVLRQRCARINSVTRQVLQMAAVIGQQFDLSILLQASQLGEEAIIDSLEEGTRARLIQEVPGEDACNRFVSTLAHDAVYESLSGSRRAFIHRRVAEAIEGSHCTNLPSCSAALAHHFKAGGETEKARHYCVSAGDHALSCLAYEGAAHHYECALSLAGDQPDDERWRCPVLMALATAHRKAGNVASAREAYLEATKLARNLEDPTLLATCALGLSGGGRGVSAWIADEVR
ncbi:MAG: AAA family ATPase, partial [Actinobacteria bacterium]|nr:AAA family ATPase [Actinomycetota bacterium]